MAMLAPIALAAGSGLAGSAATWIGKKIFGLRKGGKIPTATEKKKMIKLIRKAQTKSTKRKKTTKRK